MDIALILLSLGALFVAGLAADQIGHRTRLPRVTLLLGCGIVAGGAGFDLIPPHFYRLFIRHCLPAKEKIELSLILVVLLISAFLNRIKKY